MDRLIAADTVAPGAGDRPPITGTPGDATDGNSATGTPPSEWPAYAWNMICEEMRNTILAAGLAPDIQNYTQLAQASGIVGRRMRAFTATGAFVVPAGVFRVKVRLWGGGAGGGGTLGSGSGGSGGGAGAFGEGVFPVVPGATIPVTVAAGGAPGGNVTPSNGGAGATSSFGSLISATGGNPGLAANGALQTFNAAGGTSAGGAVSIPGNPSGTPYSIGASGMVSGVGGGGFGAGYPPISVSGSAQDGQPGLFPGGGANGGLLGGKGGAGAQGLVIVEF